VHGHLITVIFSFIGRFLTLFVDVRPIFFLNLPVYTHGRRAISCGWKRCSYSCTSFRSRHAAAAGSRWLQRCYTTAELQLSLFSRLDRHNMWW